VVPRTELHMRRAKRSEEGGTPYLSESFALPVAVVVFFLFGVGILHSMEKATQFVHGTPKLAASHRTYLFRVNRWFLGGQVFVGGSRCRIVTMCQNRADHAMWQD